MEYLSREELRELVGSPQRARQIAWLAREGWPFVVNCKGRVLVSRAYHDRAWASLQEGLTLQCQRPPR